MELFQLPVLFALGASTALKFYAADAVDGVPAGVSALPAIMAEANPISNAPSIQLLYKPGMAANSDLQWK